MLSEAKDLGSLFCACKMHRSFAAKAPLRMTTFNMSAKKSVFLPVKEVKRSCPSSRAIPQVKVSLHQLTSTNETLSPGMEKSKRTAPSLLSTHFGDSSVCSCPAAFNDWYCSAVGDCGDAIAFHTV